MGFVLTVLFSFLAGVISVVFLAHYSPTKNMVRQLLGSPASSSNLSAASNPSSSGSRFIPANAFKKDAEATTPARPVSPKPEVPKIVETPSPRQPEPATTTTPAPAPATVSPQATSEPTSTAPRAALTKPVNIHSSVASSPQIHTDISALQKEDSGRGLAQSNRDVPVHRANSIPTGLPQAALMSSRSPILPYPDAALQNHAGATNPKGKLRFSSQDTSSMDDDTEEPYIFDTTNKDNIVFSDALEVKLPGDSLFSRTPLGERWVVKFGVLRQTGVLSIFGDSSMKHCEFHVVLNGCEIINKPYYGRRWKIQSKYNVPFIRIRTPGCKEHGDPHNDTYLELQNHSYLVVKSDRSVRKTWMNALKTIIKGVPDQPPASENRLTIQPDVRMLLSARIASISMAPGAPLVMSDHEIQQLIENKPLVPIQAIEPAMCAIPSPDKPAEIFAFTTGEEREAMITKIVGFMKRVSLVDATSGVEALKQECTALICNFLYPLKGSGYSISVLDEKKGSFKISIRNPNTPVATIPSNSRIPFTVHICPTSAELLEFKVLVQSRQGTNQDELILDVGGQVQLKRVSNEEIEKIVETMPNVPLINLRNHARKNLLLSDEIIYYYQFVFFPTLPANQQNIDVRIRVVRDMNEETAKRTGAVKSNLDKLRSYESFARSALNYGLMMLYPEEGGKANLINVLFGPKLTEDDPHGRLTWVG